MKEFRYYLLNEDGTITPTNDTLAWGMWFENFKNRQIDYTKITNEIEVSTVALGLDHSYNPNGPPMIFESMSFGYDDEIQRRYSTLEEAKVGHNEIVKEIREELGLPMENLWEVGISNILNER